MWAIGNTFSVMSLDVNVNSGSKLARKWFMRCETSDGWYAAATTFEVGTKDRKKYLLKAIKEMSMRN